MNVPNAALAAVMATDLVRGAGDQLDKIRELVRQLRDREREAADLKERLTETNKQIQELRHKALVDAMQEAGVDTLGLPPEGNLPGYTAELRPYYHANIAADWEQTRKVEAYEWLTENGHGDLLKMVVSVSFGRREYEQARDLDNKLRAMGLQPHVEATVPWNTLTAWLREQVEKYHRTPPLELLGAQVGSVVKLTPRKD